MAAYICTTWAQNKVHSVNFRSAREAQDQACMHIWFLQCDAPVGNWAGIGGVGAPDLYFVQSQGL